MRDKKIRNKIYVIFVKYIMKFLLICNPDYKVSTWISDFAEGLKNLFGVIA